MNFKRLFSGVMTAAIAGAAAIVPVSATHASPGARFTCLTKQGVPATVALTSRGPVPVIVWKTTLGGTYTPQVRCDIVSKRFQQYYENGTLNFLTTGRKNRLPVVCVAQYKNGPCAQDLFTLKPGANPGRTLRQLMAVRTGSAGPLNESAAREYIDIKNLLETAPVDNSIAVPKDTATEPTQPESVETAITPATTPKPTSEPVKPVQPEEPATPETPTQVEPTPPTNGSGGTLW